MTSADVEVGQTVSQASTEAATDKKENGHMNGSIENGDAHKPDEKKHSSSGHHSSSKDKDHDRSKDRHSSSSKDKDKHRSSSSHHSSSKDKDRHRSDKDKDRHRSDKEKDRHRSDRDKERSDKDKDRHRDKDKHRSDKDRHRSDKDKDRDKDKSRSSDKDKDKHRSSDGKDKDRKSHSSSSSKDKDRHSSSSKSKDKDRHSSSSSHHKDRHSSSSHHRSDKDKDKSDRHSSSHRDREKDHERRERKERDKREKEEAERMKNGRTNNTSYNDAVAGGNDARFDDEYSMELGSTVANGLDSDLTVKTEPDSPVKQEHAMPRMTMTLVSETVKEEDKDESMDHHDDDADEADSGADEGKLTMKEEGSEQEENNEDNDSDNEPLAAKLARVRRNKPEVSQDSADESDDEPLSKKLAKVQKAQAAKGKISRKRKHSDHGMDSGSDSDNYGGKMDVDGNETSDDDLNGGGDARHEDDTCDDEMRAAKSSQLAPKLEPGGDDATTGSSCSDDDADSQSDNSDEKPLADKLESARKRARVDDQSMSQETGYGSTSDSDEPLSKKLERYKAKSRTKARKNKLKAGSDDDDWGGGGDSDDSGAMKKRKKTAKTKGPVRTPVKKGARTSTEAEVVSPKKKKKAAEDEEDVWKWWEEDKKPEGVKWNTLEHKGPVFAPDYEPVPDNVPFFYNGKKMKLSPETEEIATFYARMLDHDYTQKDAFNKNFFHDWRKFMTSSEKETITDLKKCDFTKMAAYFKELTELRKNRTKDEKLDEKKKNEAQTKEYGFCIIDGHKQKIGNFKIEPPGLFRGRGEHPKMGKLKTRTQPEDVIINIGKGAPVPPPPKGHRWKEVRHDNTVTWLCCWTENIAGSNKYIMLNPSSKLKGEKDFQKYETARRLKGCVKSIRDNYQADWKSKEMRIRQRSVALYFIDKLALRAGNEKDSDEQADTVGCCSLRVEHIRLHDELDGKENVVEFDFLGKDSIRYQNAIPVEKRVYKNVKLFCENKKPGDDLFDRLNTTILNKHLNELMEGLTAKVFRTYNASKTLQEQLEQLTDPDMSIAEKMLAYNRANRAVAVLCNHQRAVPKTFEKSMENLQKKIDEKEDQIIEAKREYREAKKHGDKSTADKKHKRLQALEDQLKKLQVQATDREENKQIALGTSKLNYLDPRISVAWCKKWGVPIEKVYNKTQRDKFRWAIEMVEGDYKF